MRALSQQVREISTAIQTVAGDSQESVTSINDIKRVTCSLTDEAQNVSVATQEQSASIHKISAASISPANMAAELQSTVERF